MAKKHLQGKDTKSLGNLATIHFFVILVVGMKHLTYAVYGEHGLWVRPAKMFFETIERDGKRIKRFEQV